MKAFLEVFPGLHMTDQMQELLTLVSVDRVSMTDWYNTDSRTHIHFKAHSVVGGYFMKMFDAKYNGR